MIWKLFMGTDRIVFWSSCALFFIAVFSRSFGRGNSIELAEGRFEFPPSRLGYFCFVTMAASLPLSLNSALLHRRFTIFDYIMTGYVILLAITICLSIPGTIATDPKEITQTFWFRRNKHVRLNEIVEVKTTIRGPIEIRSSDRTKISHSLFLAGRERFLLEIKRYCGEELPADFPREPMEEIEPRMTKQEKN